MEANQEHREICKWVGHCFKPLEDGTDVEPYFDICTFCGTSVELLPKKQVEYLKADEADVKVPPPKSFRLSLSPKRFGEMKAMAQAAGVWSGDGFERKYRPSTLLAEMFDSWVKDHYPAIRNHIGPVLIELNWAEVER